MREKTKKQSDLRQKAKSASLEGQVTDELLEEALCPMGAVESRLDFQLQKALKSLHKIRKLMTK